MKPRSLVRWLSMIGGAVLLMATAAPAADIHVMISAGARGEAEIGFQQVSELIHVPGISFVGTIPAEVQPTIFFAGALTSSVQQPEAASALIRFLASSEAAPVISKAGLLPLPER
jgi:ABC-type molybdate transport system substrate-binding protein